jgi:hypothetical protein
VDVELMMMMNVCKCISSGTTAANSNLFESTLQQLKPTSMNHKYLTLQTRRQLHGLDKKKEENPKLS